MLGIMELRPNRVQQAYRLFGIMVIMPRFKNIGSAKNDLEVQNLKTFAADGIEKHSTQAILFPILKQKMFFVDRIESIAVTLHFAYRFLKAACRKVRWLIFPPCLLIRSS